MKTHATRTTCFAIISGIEDDLRALIRHVCDTLDLTSVCQKTSQLSESKWCVPIF